MPTLENCFLKIREEDSVLHRPVGWPFKMDFVTLDPLYRFVYMKIIHLTVGKRGSCLVGLCVLYTLHLKSVLFT